MTERRWWGLWRGGRQGGREAGQRWRGRGGCRGGRRRPQPRPRSSSFSLPWRSPKPTWRSPSHRPGGELLLFCGGVALFLTLYFLGSKNMSELPLSNPIPDSRVSWVRSPFLAEVMAQPTFFLQECQPWLQLPPFFAQCPNWGTQVPILKDLFQTYSSCNKNTKTTTLLLQHIGSLIKVIFLHYILQEFCSGLPRLSKNKSTMWYAKRLVTITKYFFMAKIRTKQLFLKNGLMISHWRCVVRCQTEHCQRHNGPKALNP